MTAKIAKDWFLKNPRSIVVFHCRWNDLPASSREFMGAPRTTRVSGNTVWFSPQQSVVALFDSDNCVNADGDLELRKNGTHIVTYRAAPEAHAALEAERNV